MTMDIAQLWNLVSGNIDIATFMKIEVGSIAQLLSAIGTVSAVLIVLYKDSFLRWLRRPQLHVTLDLNNPDCHKTSCTVGGKTSPCYYFRLFVRNEGKTAAENVQVYVSDLKYKGVDESEYSRYSNFLPMNFLWSYASSDDRARAIFMKRIAPRMGRHCDFFHIIQNDYANFYGKADKFNRPHNILLDLEFEGAVGNHILRPGEYNFTLLFAADNCYPTEKHVKVSYDGRWDEEPSVMFSKHIDVTL